MFHEFGVLCVYHTCIFFMMLLAVGRVQCDASKYSQVAAPARWAVAPVYWVCVGVHYVLPIIAKRVELLGNVLLACALRAFPKPRASSSGPAPGSTVRTRPRIGMPSVTTRPFNGPCVQPASSAAATPLTSPPRPCAAPPADPACG